MKLGAIQGEVDLKAKLDEWERLYNFARQHGAHNSQIDYLFELDFCA